MSSQLYKKNDTWQEEYFYVSKGVFLPTSFFHTIFFIKIILNLNKSEEPIAKTEGESIGIAVAMNYCMVSLICAQ